MVSVVPDNRAACLSTEEIIANSPGLSAEAVQAAIGYAAGFSYERIQIRS